MSDSAQKANAASRRRRLGSYIALWTPLLLVAVSILAAAPGEQQLYREMTALAANLHGAFQSWAPRSGMVLVRRLCRGAASRMDPAGPEWKRQSATHAA